MGSEGECLRPSGLMYLKHQRLGAYKQQRVAQSSRGRKFKFRALADSVSGLQTAGFLLCVLPHVVKGARELSGVSFRRALILFLRAPSNLMA